MPERSDDAVSYEELPENYLEVLDEIRSDRWEKIVKGEGS